MNISSPQKIALVTGASRGIGAATALLLSQQAYRVCINYRKDEASAQAIVKHIQYKGGEAIALKADVSIEDEVVHLFHYIHNRWGKMDALVNNVGIVQARSDLIHMSAERMQKVLLTNVMSTMLCSREAIKHMSTACGGKGGGIVNISSAASRTGSPHEYVDYAASKGAIDTFTKGLSLELAPQGIRVNAVRPGFIDTSIHEMNGDPHRLARLTPHIPLGRAGRAEEVAHAVGYLLSEQAAFVTGTLIDIAGGK